MATLKNTIIDDTGYLKLPTGTTAQRPTASVGRVRFNTSTSRAEVYNNSYWHEYQLNMKGITPADYGTTAATPATSALDILSVNPSAPSGYYYLRPIDYSGLSDSTYPAQSIYCDMTGSISGIGTPGWMRFTYSADLYTQASPWSNTGIGDPALPPQSNFCSFTEPDWFIRGIRSKCSEIRQTIQSYGYGSVGWTYGGTGDPEYSQYMGVTDYNGVDWKGYGNRTLPKRTKLSFNGWNSSGVITPIGTDPTDANDAVWRESVAYIVEKGNKSLPIKAFWNSDVDTVNERRYFPLVSGNKSFIWMR